LVRLEAGAVVVPLRAPIFQLDDHLDALLLSDGADPEERTDVYDPDATDLHVVPLEFVAPADQHIVSATRDLHDVVRDEAVATLDEVQHTLALPDPAPPDEEEADAVDIGKGAVHRDPGRELALQVRLDATVEFPGLELRPDQRHALLVRLGNRRARHVQPLGHYDRRHAEGEELFQDRPQLGPRKRTQVADLRLAQDLDPPAGEALGEPRQDEAGTRDVGRLDRARKTGRPRQQLELKGFA